ncbi:MULTISPECIES: alpha/beta fold hydrolase [Streptomyces]|uniref:alpha/beta fold hydrolase n=1 Tax=Streptomyces TaxID=1883 RepID=UPI0033F5A1FB
MEGADNTFPALCGTPDTFTGDDVDEFARSYARTGAFAGASGLYGSMLTEGDEIRASATRKLGMPMLAVGGGSGGFTSATVRQVAADVSAVLLEGIGRYAALEAPDRLADALMSFCKEVDSAE